MLPKVSYLGIFWKFNVIKIYCYIFFKTFIVLPLTFRSLIHYTLFGYGINKGPTLFFCTWLSGCPSTIYWEGYSFTTEKSWHLCWKSVHHRWMVLFLLFELLLVVTCFQPKDLIFNISCKLDLLTTSSLSFYLSGKY